MANNRRTPEPNITTDYKELSRILESVVVKIVQHGGYDLKYQRIYIDINNYLYKIWQANTNIEISNKVLNCFKNKIDLLLSDISNPEKFTNFSIQFEFLHYQLTKLYPGGRFTPSLKLDDHLAETWWYQHFPNLLYVEPNQFWDKFSKKFPKLDDTDCILKSITFTQCNWFDNINKSSFNLFLKLYGGWENLENYWLNIYHHPGNLGMVTTENSKTFLENVKKQLGNLRTIHKSFVFCFDWRSTEGLWNMIYAEEDDSIQVNSLKCTDLIRELQNIEKYKFPKGMQMTKMPFVCNVNYNILPEPPISPQGEDYIYEDWNSVYSNDSRGVYSIDYDVLTATKKSDSNKEAIYEDINTPNNTSVYQESHPINPHDLE